MKILNLEQFRKLPPYTLYTKYKPCIFWDIHTKYDTWDFDFLCASLIDFKNATSSDAHSAVCDNMEQGKSELMDFEHTGRDGMFEDKQLFAVFEKQDLDDLIAHLQKCKEACI